MTNAEKIIEMATNDRKSLTDYIRCPMRHGCPLEKTCEVRITGEELDRACTNCKLEWLEEEAEDM